MYHLQTGDVERAISCLHTAWEMLAQSTDRVTRILNRGLLAVAHLRRGEYRLAQEMADTTADLIGRAWPVTSSTFDGYVAVPQVYLALWEASLDPSRAPVDVPTERVAEQARKACKALRAYAFTFPIGRPRAWLYRGWYDWLSGRARRAQKAWRRSLAEAERLAMPYEEGLAHYEIGRHLPGGSPERREHLGRAAEVLARLGAVYDLEQVNRALKNETA
jgi:tetratricopeptide (TPR) repeat protein